MLRFVSINNLSHHIFSLTIQHELSLTSINKRKLLNANIQKFYLTIRVPSII